MRRAWRALTDEIGKRATCRAQQNQRSTPLRLPPSQQSTLCHSTPARCCPTFVAAATLNLLHCHPLLRLLRRIHMRGLHQIGSEEFLRGLHARGTRRCCCRLRSGAGGRDRTYWRTIPSRRRRSPSPPPAHWLWCSARCYQESSRSTLSLYISHWNLFPIGTSVAKSRAPAAELLAAADDLPV